MPETKRGRWWLRRRRGISYLVPVERNRDWVAYLADAEPGESSAIVPAWALAVPDDVVITEVEF